jgi:AraC-like DNA-binding protein
MAAVTEAPARTPLAGIDEAQVPSRSCRFSSERTHRNILGYRILEIAAHLGVHYSTVSRRLNEMEQEEKHVALQDVALNLLNVRSGPGPVR